MLLFIHIHICLSLHPLVNIFTNLGQYETDCDNVGKSAHQMNQMNDEDSHRITSVLTNADFCNFSDNGFVCYSVFLKNINRILPGSLSARDKAAAISPLTALTDPRDSDVR